MAKIEKGQENQMLAQFGNISDQVVSLCRAYDLDLKDVLDVLRIISASRLYSCSESANPLML